MSKKVYNIINEKIVEGLKEAKKNGCKPIWEMPWISVDKQNRITGHVYRGVNRFLLAMDRDEDFYITFNQIKNRKGAHLKKDSKHRIVIYWKMLEFKDKETGEEKTIPMLRYYRVYKVSDTEGIPEKKIEGEKDNKKKADFEKWFNGVCRKLKVKVKIGGSQPCYVPAEDTIYCPDIKRFKNSDHYYQAMAHELIHATGSKERLNRIGYQKKEYAKEELVAEIGSAYICNMFGIKLVKHNIAYIDSWINAINEDYKLVVSAGGKAEKAIELINNI